MKALLVGIMALLAVGDARASVWDCNFKAYVGSGTVHAQYRLEGRLVYDVGTADEPYRVLENSATALVAAWGGSAAVPELGGVSTGTSTLLIRKDSGALVLGYISWTPRGPKSETTSGVCHPVAH